MAFEPNSTIYLLNVPFERDYKNVVHYVNKEDQYNQMTGAKVKEFKEYTYQRKDNVIRLGCHIDTIYNCNYVMYKNKNHSDKWFYAFITKLEYVNDGCTLAYIETDVYNTWLWDITINPSFVEREHCSDDTPYTHTLAEGLELGDYIYNSQPFIDLNTEPEKCKIVMAVTEHVLNGGADFSNAVGGNYGGVYSGVGYKPYSTPASINTAITIYANGGKSEAIQSIFLAPEFLCQTDSTNAIAQSNTSKTYMILVGNPPSTLDGYTPKNNKLLSYPYMHTLLTNNQGGSAIYKNELFDREEGSTLPSIEFEVHGTLTPGCSIRCIPLNYNNIEKNFDEGVNLGKFPICNWQSDVYTNWLTQNGVNLQYQTATGVASMISGTAQGAMMGGVGGPLGALFGGVAGAVNGASQIMGVIGEKEKHKIMPDQASGNLNSGDVTYASSANCFKIYHISIKAEYAKIIDEYFEMFGYQCNRVKIPNTNHRPNWWYTKTISCNIDGAIPQEDLAKFRAIYDNGVTFWRNFYVIENYSLDNRI